VVVENGVPGHNFKFIQVVVSFRRRRHKREEEKRHLFHHQGTSADAAQDRAPFLKTGIGTPPRAGALKARKSCRLRQRSDTRHYWRNVVYTSMDTSSKLLVSQATYQEEDELRGTVSEGEAKGKSHSNPNPTWIREMGTSCLVTDDSNLLLSKSPKSGQQFQEEGK
jgi:hypothetical protein